MISKPERDTTKERERETDRKTDRHTYKKGKYYHKYYQQLGDLLWVGWSMVAFPSGDIRWHLQSSKNLAREDLEKASFILSADFLFKSTLC